MRYLPNSPADRQAMLAATGHAEIDELFAQIPAELRLNRKLNLPGPLAESEILDFFRQAASESSREYVPFLGAGAYAHYSPVAIDALISRGEFFTAYTPYQAEIAQGTLQAMFEFQTMMTQLTGQEVSNASLWDGSTATTEAALMAMRITGRHRVVLAKSLHPEYRQIVHTYSQNQDVELAEVPYAATGQIDLTQLESAIDAHTAAVVVQSPNFFGVLERVAEIAAIAHRHGALLIVSINEPLSLAVVKPPSEADIVCGEAQSFGVPVSYGGPYVGFLTTRDKFVRQMPGRLVGQTVDTEGRRGFVLTLATREQHIRREKATSNICTNQALFALAATIYLTLLGKAGLRQLAEQNLSKAHYAAGELRKLPGFSTPFAGPHFNEFVVKVPGDAEGLLETLRQEKIIGGLHLGEAYPELANHLLLCFTELVSRASIDRLAAVCRKWKVVRMITKSKIRVARPHVNRNERLIFQRSSPGKVGAELAPLDVPAVSPADVLGKEMVRDEIAGFPEVSELEVIRHFTRLSTWNYGVDTGLYPLGSCTMKYNARINEKVSRLLGIAMEHPYTPQILAQGCLRILHETGRCLEEITGMDAVSLQPAAGAQGELTGILMIHACLAERGDARKYILIPDSAHGTNPASVTISGYQVRPLKSNAQGCIDLADLERAMDSDVAGLMLTNPNTLGIFETDIAQIAEIVHARGGLVYMDGANMNALVGVARPGDFGIDVMHLNLHKTFSTPHGGGGPGSGPVAIKKFLEPYLPSPIVEKSSDGKFSLNYNRPKSIGRVRAFTGNFGMAVRALAYMLANGPEGLRQTTEDAVLNANYIRTQLRDSYDLPFDKPCMHECVFSDARQVKKGVHTMDIAKRLIDYGFHPYTTAFPLIVPGAMMIEPTESASKEELDFFIEALQSIAEEVEEDAEFVLKAPYTARVTRLDEVAAARKPILRWKP